MSGDSAVDPAAAALIDFLRARGAGERQHAGGRSLLDHLVETYNIARRWGLPASLQHAALIHSVYGTDVYRGQTVPLSERDELVRLAGAEAERIAYLFAVTPRGPLLAGTYKWMQPGDDAATRSELDAVVLLHMANLAAQACSRDGSPASWLVRLRDMAEPLLDADSLPVPRFVAILISLTEENETLARRSYSAALRDENLVARASALGLAAAACPVAAEPCVWLAHLAWGQNDLQAARGWASAARTRLNELGTAWDKRLTFEQWLNLATTLQDGSRAQTHLIGDPRQLFEAVVAGTKHPTRARAGGDAARFHRYVESLSDGDDARLGKVYPDLASQPWYDARDFPLAVYLESNFAAIREEIRALAGSGFHEESERIGRAGDWDVAFFYERGRRRDELCAACPTITRGIETYPVMRTMAGLSYVSRMGPRTHIAAHRGPTNLRVRCHLGIEVPDGDCAIRVGAETRGWEEGRCIVFDDFYEHEAWNHTGQERVVLIVDLWHPALSAVEIRLLEGLHTYTYAHARRLGRYWAANAAAMRASAGD